MLTGTANCRACEHRRALGDFRAPELPSPAAEKILLKVPVPLADKKPTELGGLVRVGHPTVRGCPFRFARRA